MILLDYPLCIDTAIFRVDLRFFHQTGTITEYSAEHGRVDDVSVARTDAKR